jgi:hypothetical protein
MTRSRSWFMPHKTHESHGEDTHTPHTIWIHSFTQSVRLYARSVRSSKHEGVTSPHHRDAGYSAVPPGRTREREHRVCVLCSFMLISQQVSGIEMQAVLLAARCHTRCMPCASITLALPSRASSLAISFWYDPPSALKISSASACALRGRSRVLSGWHLAVAL